MPKAKEKVKAPASKGISGVDLKDKYAVLKDHGRGLPVVRRIVLCTGGFGCHPYTLGTAVFGKEVVNDESYRYDRQSFERLATDEEVEEAKDFYKRNGFENVCKKHERGLKLLLMVKSFGRAMRLLRHKKDGIYKLFVYTMADEAWSINAAGSTFTGDAPDALLLTMHEFLNGK